MNSTANKIEIYTDGACSGNPGKGAFAYVIILNNQEIIRNSNGFINTTNNRMELMAIIEALKYIKNLKDIKIYEIKIYSDSKYIVDSINKQWLDKWILNNFKKVKNIDLWKQYLSVSDNLNINFEWVEGHAGNKYNEICDKLATNYIKNGVLIEDIGYK